jgi:hypothetical protein
MSAILLTKEPGGQSREYSALKNVPGLAINQVGGKFITPAEFDTERFASAFYLEGQESRAMQADQQLLGIPLIAEGWQVWKYPKFLTTSGKQVPHPLADQPHRVAGSSPDENYVLHFRSKDVQDQVNRAYADLSHDAMKAEILGETASGENTEGLITERYLKQHLGVDREVEESAGHSTAVHGGNPQGTRLQPRSQQVSK